MRIAGLACLVAAAALILVGAYRKQGDTISTGLMFLAMGVVFGRGVLHMGWPVKVGLGALAIIGVVYALVT